MGQYNFLILSPCNSVKDLLHVHHIHQLTATAAAHCACTVELQSTKDMYQHIEYCTSSWLFADLRGYNMPIEFFFFNMLPCNL